ncbi:dimethyladenosine transferase 2, mitochondrial [Drosophila sechellia]|uniref:rRNA adenine N(6)-methyltransferase n=1 Tax=Drosophila sechellia TaxID=7238 RepID=B4HJA9_DROSE|nr:dimethyladenosine transferase 2, mitochondrial [Drosophila sechellia]EDW42781.1 GM23852 [Drosophila sechellia]
MLPLRCSWSWGRANFSTKARKELVTRYSAEFPEKLLNRKRKVPTHMYIANSEAAARISQYLEPHFQSSGCDTVMELNSGAGYFTRHLLDRESQFRRIILLESMDHFMPKIQELHTLYPERVKVRQGDFVNLWKLVYMDKIDGGSRVADLLSDVPQKAFTDDINMLVFGAVGSYPFFKHLINSLIFQTSLFNLGRCEMILAMPPPIYIHLTCNNEIGYLIYRSTSVLFQILFEHKFIAKVPREDFLPQQTAYSPTKSSKLGKVQSINPEYLYLVKFTPRRNLHELCQPQDLPALWFFIKQNYVSRRNRIIPNLEKWVPGCGPRLIINPQSPESVTPIYPDELPKKLPQYSCRSTTMSTRNYYPGINIYTQFGDLLPSQMLTLFSQFRQWPEYGESSFLASLENALLKLETANDEQNLEDGVTLPEEDDAEADEIIEEESPETATTPAKRRRKASS